MQNLGGRDAGEPGSEFRCRCPMLGKNDCALNARNRQQRVLDFAGFDPVTSNLDLLVVSPKIGELTRRCSAA